MFACNCDAVCLQVALLKSATSKVTRVILGGMMERAAGIGRGRTVAFIHPDLGIGGAERLIVDTAVALQQNGYKVCIITSYHNTLRAFPETVNGTLRVISVGQWIPRSVFGSFVALCAYFKMIYASLYLTLVSCLRPNFVVCDQVSACIPFLRLRWNPWSSRPHVLFYCHFPDLLLTQRATFFKRVYRWPIDWFEELTTKMADKIVVNSEYTCGVFKHIFKRITISPEVLYPSINSHLFDRLTVEELPPGLKIPNSRHVFVSVNRFEPKKNIGLAISAMKKLKQCLDEPEWETVHLVLAGGYDERLTDSVEYLEQLKKKVAKEQLEHKVTFVLSPSDAEKVYLLWRCTALIYTPSNEHFGIVPLEAMYMKKPVIAVDSGGPRETVQDEITGFLCPAMDTHFGVAMARLVKDSVLAKQLGIAGKQRFMKLFSFEAFANNWVKAIESMQQAKAKSD